MKKIKRASTKNDLAKYDNLFVKDTISLDDKKNEKYFDNLSYQLYLRTFSIGNGDNDEKRRNHNNVQRSRKKSRIKKDKK